MTNHVAQSFWKLLDFADLQVLYMYIFWTGVLDIIKH